VAGQDAVADVAALAFEEVVELVADLGAADDRPADVRDQEGSGNQITGQVQAATTIIEPPQIGAPRYARLELEAEGVAFRRHDLKSVSVGGLIIIAKRSKQKSKAR
jgi:hypothetical protein